MRDRSLWPALIAALILSCGGAAAQGAATPSSSTPLPYEPRTDLSSLAGAISVDGSSTVYPITDEAALRFMDLADDVRITVAFSGTGGGFAKFCNGETDIQDASRPIQADEQAACAAAGVQYYAFEVAYDGISVVVNPKNDFVTCLTVDQLKYLWRNEDPAKTWRDLDPTWPDDRIELYGPGPASGTYDYFVEAIIGVTDGTDMSRTDYFPSENDLDLVAGVESLEDALGFFGYAYYVHDKVKLKLVAVDAGAGCISPSPATIADGTYRPLSRPLFVYVKAATLQRPEVQEFVRFYLANAPQLAVDVGYVAAPASAYAEDQAKIEGAIAGTTPPGGPQ
jgi:phosphate transport system substrate-binding protein